MKKMNLEIFQSLNHKINLLTIFIGLLDPKYEDCLSECWILGMWQSHYGFYLGYSAFNIMNFLGAFSGVLPLILLIICQR
ncbi:hypothetical protein JCM15415_18150 [Methanobacterium movens]